MTPSLRTSFLAFLLVSGLLFGLAASAVNFTWTGGISSNWAVNGNWNTTGFPDGTGDTATVNTAAAIDLNGPQSAAQLTVSANNAVTLANSGAGALTLGVSGGAAVSSFIRSAGSSSTTVNAPLVIAGRSTSGASFSIAGSGNLTFNGLIDMTAAKSANQNFISMNSTSKVTFDDVVNFGSIGTRQYIYPANGEIWFNADNSNMSSSWAQGGFYIKPGNTSGATGVGTVMLGHDRALGSANIIFGENDSAQGSFRTVRLALATEGLNVGNAINMRGEGSGMAVGGLHASGLATYTGGVLLSAASNPGRFFSDNSAATTRFSGLISGNSGPAVIQGYGTVEFTRAAGNTYGGGTTVTSGTLLVNNTSNSGTGSGAVTVKTGGTLGGIGRITGNTAIEAGGILSPGNSIGTLTFTGNVDLDGILLAEFNSAGASDLLAVSGLLDPVGGTLQLSRLGGGPIDHDHPYIVASYGSLAGPFASIQGGYLSIDYNYLGGNQIAVFIPEPASLTLLGLALGAAFNRRPRRRDGSRADFVTS